MSCTRTRFYLVFLLFCRERFCFKSDHGVRSLGKEVVNSIDARFERLRVIQRRRNKTTQRWYTHSFESGIRHEDFLILIDPRL